MSLGDAVLASEFPGRPRSATAGCYFCGTHRLPADPGVLDTGHYVEMEGYIYVCLPCVDHIANVCGLLDRATAAKLREKNTELSNSNRKLGTDLRTVQGLAAAFENALKAKAAK